VIAPAVVESSRALPVRDDPTPRTVQPHEAELSSIAPGRLSDDDQRLALILWSKVKV